MEESDYRRLRLDGFRKGFIYSRLSDRQELSCRSGRLVCVILVKQRMMFQFAVTASVGRRTVTVLVEELRQFVQPLRSFTYLSRHDTS